MNQKYEEGIKKQREKNKGKKEKIQKDKDERYERWSKRYDLVAAKYIKKMGW